MRNRRFKDTLERWLTLTEDAKGTTEQTVPTASISRCSFSSFSAFLRAFSSCASSKRFWCSVCHSLCERKRSWELENAFSF